VQIGHSACGVCKKARNAIGVVDFMRAMAENVGAPLLTPCRDEASTTWQLLHQFSAKR